MERPSIDELRCTHPDSHIDGCQYVRHTGFMTTVALPTVDLACCAPLTREPLSASAAVAPARTLKAFAGPARLRLLSMVAAHEGGEACVCALPEPLGLSQPTVSHHLKILVDAGL